MSAKRETWRRSAVLLFIVTALTVQQQIVLSRPMPLGSGPDELFEAVLYGRLFADGRAVVADARAQFVRLYDRNGVRIATMGRAGKGPGEFAAIMGLRITPKGDIGVWDGRLQRLTLFDPQGRLISTHPVHADNRMAGNLELFLGSWRNGDLLLGTLRMDRRPAQNELLPERWILGRFAVNGQLRAAAGEIPGMIRMHRAPLPFSPIPRVALRGDSVVIANGYAAQLKVLTADGRLVRTIALPWRTRAPQHQWSVLEAKLRQRNKPLLLELLREAPRDRPLPVMGGLLADDRGQLWVKEYDPAGDAIWLKRNALEIAPGGFWRVLSPDGRWVARVRIPENVSVLDIRGDRLLGVARDEFDVEQAVVYTITR
jgi:hypothetical protein